MVQQRDALGAIPAYRQGAIPDRPDLVKLTSNENPYEPLPSVREAVAAELHTLHLYPSMSATELVEALARRHGVTPDEIALGAGSVEVAAQLVSAAAGDGDEVLFAWRSFEAYPILTRIAGATPVMVPLTHDERHDLDAMADAITERTRLVLLCNPNNPTGTTLGADEVRAFLDRVPEDVLVVLDEAYVEFNRRPDSAIGIELFRERANVAVLHTFSKAYGLAGLRIGYAIARADVADNLRRVALPFGVTGLAQRAALASLAAERELLDRVDAVVAERARVLDALVRQGWAPSETEANFVWLRTGARTEEVSDALAAAGILVRAFPGEGIRITIGSPLANDRLIEAASTLAPVATP
ncbi:histidinol-phosphate transaminase [Pseudoclavibacter chungangensis]|uniref:Aromatic amino acid aminotransferase n=1 Tax=Pseudoclavibacter chungangensis TaxID=587635 RepID=A0A7J5BRM7_9MICO|nr:histidinol-phosphate transaminase [Pseudoclavibacter chungangensis]KAB1655097.1 histidinol-phosphate transaminase [Pseudoclavibacter chungangensis]NYJ66133.1 histidinol-phosphate aminotransferase [Pseudoclavibacter chungangensis]